MQNAELPKKEDLVIDKPTKVEVYSTPTDLIDLPSKGLVYPEDHPLRQGKLEMKYMTAKEEDILSTESFIRNGTVMERFLNSLIATPGITYDDLIAGDVEAALIAARINGYGSDYEAKVTTPSGKTQLVVIDLSDLKLKYLEDSLLPKSGINRFEFTLPASKRKIVFKLLSGKDLSELQKELKKDEKSFSKTRKLSSIQLSYHILSIDGETDRKKIKELAESMLAFDARAFRKHLVEIDPGVDLSLEVTDEETGEPFRIDFPVGPHFFWPDAEF